MSSESQQHVSDLFSKIDRDGSGALERHELAHLLKVLDDVNWTDQKVDRIFDIIDIDGNGCISPEEFVNWAFGLGGAVCVMGAEVCAHGLQGAAEFNGKYGRVVATREDRVVVDFGPLLGQKAIKSKNLRIEPVPHGTLAEAPAPGKMVRTYGLRHSSLNGLWGPVLETSDTRAVVDLGAEVGKRSIKFQNLQAHCSLCERKPRWHLTRVRAHGLVGAPELNGLFGTVVSEQENRIEVDFGSPHGHKKLKHSNLQEAYWSKIGIDLGTSRCYVAAVCDGQIRVLLNRHGKPCTPSIVAFTESGTLLGEDALLQAASNPQGTFSMAKRCLGTALQEPAIEVLSALLKGLVEDAEAALSAPVESAVLTVPACASWAERVAATLAAESIGLKVTLLEEPTAAVIPYVGLGSGGDTAVLVVDLGGGTFDTSLVIVESGILEVVSSFGDAEVGGEDFTTQLVHKCMAEFGMDLTNDSASLQQLRAACEDAKVRLTSALQADIMLEGTDFRYTITRQEFRDLNEVLLQRCRECVSKTLRESYLSPHAVKHLLFVGGASRMSCVKEALSEVVPRATWHSYTNADQCVALGAAVYGAMLSRWSNPRVAGLLLLDVFPSPLSIELKGGLALVVIEKGTTYPTFAKVVCTTVVDNQAAVDIRVYAGGHVSDGRHANAVLIGSMRLQDLPAKPKGTLPIEVVIFVDGRCKVSFSANWAVTDTGGEYGRICGKGLTRDRPQIQATSRDAVPHKVEDSLSMQFQGSLDFVKGPQWLRPDKVRPEKLRPAKADSEPSLAIRLPPTLELHDRLLGPDTHEQAVAALREAATCLCIHDVELLVRSCSNDVKNVKAKGLTATEKMCLFAYTWDYCLVSVEAPGHNYFEKMNKALHDSKGDDLERCLRIAVYYTMSAITKLPGVPAASRIFRGIKDASIAAEYVCGAMVYWRTFVSTTTELIVAMGFAGKHGLIFDVTLNDAEARASARLEQISAFGGDEGEVLLRPNLCFVVSEVIERSGAHGGRTVVRLVQVLNDRLVRY